MHVSRQFLPSFRAAVMCTTLGFLGLTGTTRGIAANDGLPPEAYEALDAIVTGKVQGSPEISGLQMVVIRDGKPVFTHATGLARVDTGENIPLTLDHKMRIASISKLVATIGLMKLVEKGEVDLDADVSDYLGFTLRNPNFPNDKITLRMVLSHSSSVRDASYYWLKVGEKFQDFFRPGGAHYEDGAHFASGEGQQPGEFFTYSNLNFGIMAGVIEMVSSKRFDRYMREEVLLPLGLGASYNVCDVTTVNPDGMATLFRKRDDDGNWHPDGDWQPQLDSKRFSCTYGMEPVGRGEQPGPVLEGYTPGENPTAFSPQGGLRASAKDLTKIARLLLGGGEVDGVRLLRPESVKAMATPFWRYDAGTENANTTGEDMNPDGPSKGLMQAYGLSTHIVHLPKWNLEEDRTLTGHLGDAYGLMGQFWIDFENGDALIALITGTADDPAPGSGVTPMYRAEDAVLRWWLHWFPASSKN